jgi:hypothetical protein
MAQDGSDVVKRSALPQHLSGGGMPQHVGTAETRRDAGAPNRSRHDAGHHAAVAEWA